MKTVIKKELDFYLNNPIGYIVVVLFAIFVNFFYIKDVFVSSVVSIKSLFNILPWFLMIFIPALSMRIFTEEKRLNTIEVLLTLPITEKTIVLGKFFALLILYGISLALTLGFVIFLFIFSKLSLIEVLVGYLGEILFGASLISLSIYISNKTKNQLIAFFISLLSIFFLIVISSEFMGSVLPRIVIDNLIYFSPVYHLQNFINGVITLKSLVYFLSVTLLFLFLTINDLKKRD
ncbi:MAG: gliding motility-associated ABC transporter permease subunit GldF [Patescibacteria group bacterium]|nr:MAG: gliding motility-associated ABC transporter permease subunit GldF [Patescibacteria group bacterium]